MTKKIGHHLCMIPYNVSQPTTLCPQSPLCMGDLPNYQCCLLSAKYLEKYVFNLIVGKHNGQWTCDEDFFEKYSK